MLITYHIQAVYTQLCVCIYIHNVSKNLKLRFSLVNQVYVKGFSI